MLSVPYVCAYVAASRAGHDQLAKDILLQGTTRSSRPWVDLLLEYSRSPVDLDFRRPFVYQVALLHAATQNHFVVVDSLLRSGEVNVNLSVTMDNRYGLYRRTETALTNAIRSNSVETVEALLRAGADPTVCCVPSDAIRVCSAVELAAACGTAEILRLVLSAVWERHA